jgi:hypothetical protein
MGTFNSDRLVQFCIARGAISGYEIGMVGSLLQSSLFLYNKFKFVNNSNKNTKVCRRASLAYVW